jgi:hypothetical protein
VQAIPPLTPAQQADIDQIRIDQLEMLQAVDEAIGGSTEHGIVGIMEHLRSLGIAENTIVVYLADNGWQWGEHRMRAKNKPYEESIRSPMFVHYPKLAPLARVEPGFALNIDLGPTFAELAGIGVPIAHDGVSLVRLLDGTQPAGTWRTDFLTEGWPGPAPWASVREEQWKYTEIPVTPGDPATLFETELYDLWNDPYELENVGGAHPAAPPELAGRLGRGRTGPAGGPRGRLIAIRWFAAALQRVKPARACRGARRHATKLREGVSASSSLAYSRGHEGETARTRGQGRVRRRGRTP